MLNRELLANAINVVVKAGYGTCPLVEQHLGLTFAQARELLDALEKAGVLDPPTTALPNRRKLCIQDKTRALAAIDVAIAAGRIRVKPVTSPQADPPPTADLVFAQALTRMDFRAAADAFVAVYTENPGKAAALLQLALTATAAAGQRHSTRGGGGRG